MKVLKRSLMITAVTAIFMTNTIAYASNRLSVDTSSNTIAFINSISKSKNDKLPTYIQKKALSSRSGETSIVGEVPMISGMTSKDLENKINSKIDQIYNREILSLDGVSELSFRFDVKSSGSIETILIYHTKKTSSSITKVDSINYNTKTNKLININDTNVLGPNGVKMANKHVNSKIMSNPSDFNSNAIKISDDQTFYVENDIVYLLFNQMEIAPKAKGVISIKMNIKNITPLYLGKNEYYLKSEHGIKMVQLKQVCEAFGYRLDWNSSTDEIKIMRNGDLATTVKVGSNSYSKLKSSKRPLEYAPEIHTDSRTYVPISFFEEILDIFYYVDNLGTITFSEYIDK